MRGEIDVVLRMEAPSNNSEVQYLIGAVTIYKSLLPWQSNLFTSFLEWTGTGKFHFDTPQIKTFEKMKAMAAADAISYY